MSGSFKNLTPLVFASFLFYGCGNADKEEKNVSIPKTMTLENKIYSQYYDTKLKETKPDLGWRNQGHMKDNGALTTAGRLNVECESATKAMILINDYSNTKAKLTYKTIDSVFSACKEGAADGLEKNQPNKSLYVEPAFRKDVDTNQSQQAATANINMVNGCTFEQIVYSSGYNAGKKAKQRKDKETREVELYILNGGCQGTAGAYHSLQFKEPQKYTLNSNALLKICAEASQDGFDDNPARELYRKECVDKPFIDKNPESK